MIGHESKWWTKRTPRSVDYLKLWKENPRFDTAESQSRIKLADFVEELVSEPSDKSGFFELIKSIVKLGFIDFEPVLVWKGINDRYIVAEGNRRILALKLLRHPDKAPKSIRKFVLQQSKLIDRNSIEKVQVCVAPSLEATRWYVLQRHSTSSIQKQWQRLQQQRFIVSLYDEYDHDIERIMSTTGFSRSEIIQALRFVQLRDIATKKLVTDLMSQEEKELIYSKRISMTILERWFGSEDVKELWGVRFDGMNVQISSDEDSFLRAYGHFLKLMFNIEPNDLDFVVNTRSIPERNDEIFKVLPSVTFPQDARVKVLNTSITSKTGSAADSDKEAETGSKQEKRVKTAQVNGAKEPTTTSVVKHKSDRKRIIPLSASINVESAKLKSLFFELKKVPVHLYIHVSSLTLRVFLDLSVDEFVKKNGLEKAIASANRRDYKQTTLQNRLKYICDNQIDCTHANKVIGKLLQSKNEHSLDTLNNFVHGQDTYKIDYRFVNGFWDMLTPLLKVLIELKEK